jgi:hypothetical protein
VVEPGMAEGHWGRGGQPIGRLVSNGACRDGPGIRICAWQMGEQVFRWHRQSRVRVNPSAA